MKKKALTHYRAIDFMMAAVTAAVTGDTEKAAGFLMQASQDEQVQEALEQLNEQQEQYQQQQEQDPAQQEQQLSRALARLIKANKTVAASQDQDAEEEEDQEGEEDQDSETADLVEDLDFGVDDQDAEELDEDEAQENLVNSSVARRLAKASANRKARGA